MSCYSGSSFKHAHTENCDFFHVVLYDAFLVTVVIEPFYVKGRGILFILMFCAYGKSFEMHPVLLIYFTLQQVSAARHRNDQMTFRHRNAPTVLSGSFLS